MRTLIVPCAGNSTRYNTTLPKFLLKNPSGNIMVYDAIQGLPIDFFDEIIIIVNKKHMINGAEEKIKSQFSEYKNFKLLILEKDTTSPSDTISQAILKLNIDGEIYIKDSDDYFEIKNLEPNQIAVISLDEILNITPGNKSYVKKNNQDEVLTIIEKKVISSLFCCGLYSFLSAKDFVTTFFKLREFIDTEIFVSHIIYSMILDGVTFTINTGDNFIDWGTQNDWDYFNYISKL